MTLHTTRRMPAAQAMYAALGYERGPDRVFDDGFVLLSFSKTLAMRRYAGRESQAYGRRTEVGTTSPEARSTPSASSACTRPPRNCCSYSRA